MLNETGLDAIEQIGEIPRALGRRTKRGNEALILHIDRHHGAPVDQSRLTQVSIRLTQIKPEGGGSTQNCLQSLSGSAQPNATSRREIHRAGCGVVGDPAPRFDNCRAGAGCCALHVLLWNHDIPSL